MVGIRETVKERYVELAHNRAHFYETGQGYPTIFIHGLGFTSGGEDWFPVIKQGIGDVVHVISIDQLGWGAGDRPVWNYNFAYLIDHVRELQDALGLEKTNLVGHSLGGWVAATLAYESPQRVNKLVLIAHAGLNPNPPPNLASFKPPSREEIAAGLAEMADGELKDELVEARVRNAAVKDAVEAYGGIARMFQDMDMRRRYYMERRLKHIQAPTLLVYGENDVVFPPVEGRELVRRSIPNNRYELMADTGHFIPTQRPAELTKLLKEFLAE
jgi:pimeloyl-ACP methyl ester carboxylesterase